MLSIVEAVIVLVAAALMTVQGIQRDVEKRRHDVLSLEGQNLAVINAALSNWVTDKYGTLVGQMVGGKSTPVTPPTFAELRAGEYLKADYAAGPFWGGTYMIQMSVGPDDCATGTASCKVSYVFYPSKPVTRLGQPDVAGAGLVAQAAGTGFGVSTTQNPATVNGLNGAWKATNPVPGAPAAVVMATNGPTTDGNSVFIRRDGSLKWTGSQDVNGVDLHNVGNIDATGTIAAPTLAASNVAVSNAVRTPGTLVVQNAAGTAPAPISTGDSTVTGQLHVTQSITPGAIAAPRAWCPENGAVAQNSDGRGQLLSCQDHAWLPVGGPALRHGYFMVQNGWGVPAPNCATGGTPQIVFSPVSFYVNPTATVNVSASGGGPWTVFITDGNGNGISGTAVVETYCSY
ncbi:MULTISPECIES: hypothetical protein [unclassified Burkholderia]|uniref:hypothetical protein n=1 Tax=unclassified Burkholderia TaxID=2613784 RepID=UPI00075DF369|nr:MULTISPECIES: hypothetical protein [unclassified Burkholderia]KUY92726.1 hypothetical protein WS49_26210 [Burkholderia sp. RF7-non_BP4]KUY95235.1 hypothetical protein WS48_17805 [Burkholderia sp. RF7-non_BP1]